MNREWGFALALGVLVAGGLWALDGRTGGDGPGQGGPADPTTSATPEPPRPLAFPFRDSVGLPGNETRHVLLMPLGRAAAEAHLNATPGVDTFPHEVDWQSDNVALYTAKNLFAGCQESPPGTGQQTCSDPVWVFGDWPLPRARALADNDTSPRFAEDGHSAGRVTAYVFDSRGLLLATNAPEQEAAAFAGNAQYTRLSNATWYLGGNATPPNGTERVPALAEGFVRQLRPLLEGLPVGGVASIRSNAYVSLYGTLFVTVRIDSLVYAP